MSTTPIPVFGRKYKVDVLVPQSDGSTTTITVSSDTFEPEALRVTFDVYQRAFQERWFAEICIYNLDQATTQMLLGANAQDLQVVVAAGYATGVYQAYNTIWNGPVFQALMDRENVVDYKITLVCTTGLLELTRNLINKSFAAGINQADLVQKIADLAFSKIPVGSNGISSSLKPQSMSRGTTAFGNPGSHFTDIAVDNQMQWWLGSDGIAMKSLSDNAPASPSLTYAPPAMPGINAAGNSNSTPADGVIIGTPQQTQFGVSFKVLLDPRLQIKSDAWLVVKIDNSLIRFAKKQIGDTVLNVLDQDGVYAVGGVRFTGDTRGNDWYAEVDGYTTYQAKAQILQQIAGQ